MTELRADVNYLRGVLMNLSSAPNAVRDFEAAVRADALAPIRALHSVKYQRGGLANGKPFCGECGTYLPWPCRTREALGDE